MKTLHPDDIRWQAAEGSPFLTDGEVEPDPDRRLTIRWLGTAGYELRHRGTTVSEYRALLATAYQIRLDSS